MKKIRLSLTRKLNTLLVKYIERYPALDEPEIIKMLISKGDRFEAQLESPFYHKEYITPEYEEYLLKITNEAHEELKNGTLGTASNIENFIQKLNEE